MATEEKEEFVALFEVIFQHLLKRIQEDHENLTQNSDILGGR
jgi:hypothetical protein